MPTKRRSRESCQYPPSEIAKLKRQVETLKMEARSENTGHFAKRTACIRLPPWEIHHSCVLSIVCVHLYMYMHVHEETRARYLVIQGGCPSFLKYSYLFLFSQQLCYQNAIYLYASNRKTTSAVVEYKYSIRVQLS